jgi:hypothetical protein
MRQQSQIEQEMAHQAEQGDGPYLRYEVRCRETMLDRRATHSRETRRFLIQVDLGQKKLLAFLDAGSLRVGDSTKQLSVYFPL